MVTHPSGCKRKVNRNGYASALPISSLTIRRTTSPRLGNRTQLLIRSSRRANHQILFARYHHVAFDFERTQGVILGVGECPRFLHEPNAACCDGEFFKSGGLSLGQWTSFECIHRFEGDILALVEKTGYGVKPVSRDTLRKARA